MSSFYLDIIKDRQYTMKQDSLGRRSAQTAMYQITDALVRWIAPVLSFTSDEIWLQLREQSDGNRAHRAQSVFTETYLDTLYPLDDSDAISGEDWAILVGVRDAVSKSLEVLRTQGDIGAALEASVQIYAKPELTQILEKLGDELRFVLITSTASVASFDEAPTADVQRVSDHEFVVFSQKAQGNKCVRCWHLRDDVGTNTDYPEVCGRCISNVHGDGEQRLIA